MTIDEYIQAQPEEVRESLCAVRNAIAKTLPNAEERFSWQMPTWWKNHNLIHFAAQKGHVGIYPGPEAVAEFSSELDEKGFKHSKGAIRFPYGKIDLDLIGRIAEWCGRNNT